MNFLTKWFGGEARWKRRSELAERISNQLFEDMITLRDELSKAYPNVPRLDIEQMVMKSYAKGLWRGNHTKTVE